MSSFPVSAHVTVDGWVSNGLDFSDYQRFHTSSRKQSGERRLKTPLWAMSDQLLRRVLVTFLEERAFSKKEREVIRAWRREHVEKELELTADLRSAAVKKELEAQALVLLMKVEDAIAGIDRRKRRFIAETAQQAEVKFVDAVTKRVTKKMVGVVTNRVEEVLLKERLARVQNKTMSKRPAMIRVLERLCQQYVEIKARGLNPDVSDSDINNARSQPFMKFAEGEARWEDENEKLQSLETEISGIDTYLRYTEKGGADVICGVAYLYYRVCMDSVGVAAELGLKSPHVRQLLWKLHKTADRMKASHEFDSLVVDPSILNRASKGRNGASAPKVKLVTPPLNF